MIRLAFFFLAATLLSAQAAAPEVEITAEPHHHLVLENAEIRAFYVDVVPHANTLMHWHRHDYIYVMFGASQVVNAVAGKGPVTIQLQDGQAGFTAGAFAHVVRNQDQPFRNLTIEILDDAKLRQSAARSDKEWDEDRGLDILQGGTRQVLFVKDGIRVTEFELQPGGVVPMHHHAGPHLLVAVSDLEIRSEAEVPDHFKSGDAKWFPGGYSHSITNVGSHPAKFVTLEFP
ncbi:MAG: hypothetical protein WAN60_19715 [Candidatus Sulfotelmatobacter sp.]